MKHHRPFESSSYAYMKLKLYCYSKNVNDLICKMSISYILSYYYFSFRSLEEDAWQGFVIACQFIFHQFPYDGMISLFFFLCVCSLHIYMITIERKQAIAIKLFSPFFFIAAVCHFHKAKIIIIFVVPVVGRNEAKMVL